MGEVTNKPNTVYGETNIQTESKICRDMSIYMFAFINRVHTIEGSKAAETEGVTQTLLRSENKE